jgi:hypothetical protein
MHLIHSNKCLASLLVITTPEVTIQMSSEQSSGQEILVIATVSYNSRRKSKYAILNCYLIFIFHYTCVILASTSGIRVMVKHLGACFRLIIGDNSLKINSFDLCNLYDWFLHYLYTS